MGTTNDNHFGELLKKLRRQVGMTQEDLATAIRLESSSSISHYENGTDKPKEDKLDAIISTLIERGALIESCNDLYRYSGYAKQRFSNLLTERVNNIFEGSHQETKWLLEWVLKEILDPIDKYQIALTNMRRGDNFEAQNILDKLLPSISKPFPFGDRFRLKALISDAEARRLQGDFDSAIGILKEAEVLAKSLGEEGIEILGVILKLRGNINRRLSNWKDAKEDYNNAIQAFRDYEFSSGKKQDEALANLERKLAGTHLFQGQPIDAIKHINRSLKICEDRSDTDGKIQALQHRAWAQGLLGHLNDALTIHKDIFRCADDSKLHSISIAKGYRYLGDSYRMCGMPEKALEIYDKAIEYLDSFFGGQAEKKDVLVYGTINLGIGAAYRALGNIEAAKKQLDRSLAIHSTMGAKYYEGLTRRELGKLLMTTNLAGAENEFTKSRDIFAELNNVYYLIGLNRDFAELEFRCGDYPKARSYAMKAINIARECGFTSRLAMAQLTLAKINLASPDKLIPFDLFSQSLSTALDLDRFLVYEVLCDIANQPYFLKNEVTLTYEINRLCHTISSKISDQIKKVPFPESSIISWQEGIDRLQLQLENEMRAKEFTTGRAVIVGISKYDAMRHLGKTNFDARDLNDLLVKSGYASSKITLLLDKKATKKSINRALEELACSAEPTDTVLFFFSGHGAHHHGGFHRGEYLCPVETDTGDLEATAISSNELTTAIKSIPAKQVVVFLDACHSGGVGEPKNSDGTIKAGLSEDSYEKIVETGEGRVVIASCRPDEYSWELSEMRNGLFSNYLLKGLSGNAADTDGAVRIFKLFKYISTNVPKHKSQHPLIKMTTENDFTVVMNS